MENILEPGMVFHSFKEIADAIGYSKSNRSDLILKALGHYCEYEHKPYSPDTKIINVFDKPIGFLCNDWTYNIGDVLNNQYGSFEIVDRYMKKKWESNHQHRVYLCRCRNDGNMFELTNFEIKRDAGCPLCGKRRIAPGHSLYDERPDLLQYLKNPEDAKEYAVFSNKRIQCQCPTCGAEKNMVVSNLAQAGFVCNICSDGISYPNKFVHELLDQLGVQHIPEYYDDWTNGRRYDQYLPDYSLIIENHGLQHYSNESAASFAGSSLGDQIRNDNYKMALALVNHIKNYVSLDCSLSTLEWMRQSIMKSSLPKILNFKEDNIDWNKCELATSTSKVREAWNLWNQGHSCKYIAKQLNVSTTTIHNYINRGVKCGICQKTRTIVLQDTEPRQRPVAKETPYTNASCKPIYCSTDDVYFGSRYDCETYYPGLFPEKTGSCELFVFIKHHNGMYKNKQFKYITKEEFNNALSDPNKTAIGKPYKI